MLIRPFDEGDTAAVVELWRACGLTRPWSDPEKDIARKLSEQRELFLVGELDGAFYRAIGYDVDAAVSMGKRLIPDR